MKPELSTHVMTSRRRGSGNRWETEVVKERERKGRDGSREREREHNTGNKIEKEIVCNCETSLLFWHPFVPRPYTWQGRAVAGEQDNGQCARKESAKFYIWLAGWLAFWPQDPRTCHRPKPFLIKMLTGAAKNADTLDGANREREREREREPSPNWISSSRKAKFYFLFLIDHLRTLCGRRRFKIISKFA